MTPVPPWRAGIGQDALARHRRLGEPDGLGDDGPEDATPEGIFDPAEHFAPVDRPGIVHGGEDADDLEVGVEALPDLLDGVHQQGHPAQGEVLALERDEDAVGGGEGVDGEQAETGRAVDQHVVVALAQHPKDPQQRLLAGDLPDQQDLGRGQVDVGGKEIEPFLLGALDAPAGIRLRVHQ
jgi:hypothetical protein